MIGMRGMAWYGMGRSKYRRHIVISGIHPGVMEFLKHRDVINPGI
jgi:hypothetical protein